MGNVPVGGVSVSADAGGAVMTGSANYAGEILWQDLPPGQYTVTPDPATLPAQAAGRVTGVAYEDWDGDGARGSGEALLATPLTVTLGSELATSLEAGRFLFWDAPVGAHDVLAQADSVAAGAVVVGPGQGSALAMPAVAPGVVRGIVWHDANRDGARQPWETPLSGVAITLDGTRSTVSAADGRFQFLLVAPGAHALATALPGDLVTALPGVVVGAGRGVAVGVAAAPNRAPAADAGPDQAVTAGDVVMLDGAGSVDPDGQPLIYAWTQVAGPVVALSDPAAAQPTFTAPAGPATLRFRLVVTDSLGLSSAADEGVVTVAPGGTSLFVPLVVCLP